MNPVNSGKWLKISIVVLIVLVFGNLVVLNLWMIENNRTIGQNKTVAQKQIENNGNLSSSLQNNCPAGCLTVINEATSSFKTGTANKQEEVIQSNYSGQNIKEAFVPFGSGSGNFINWADVTGLTAYVDGSKYGKIQKAVFEVSARIPNGNQVIWIVLYNVTDNAYVWSSQVSMLGIKPQFLISKPILLPASNKLYQVRMKTEIGDVAYIDQARLHIITE